MSKYTMQGREIYSDKGKLVATLDDDGNPVMAPGMAGPHTRGVREFLSADDPSAEMMNDERGKMKVSATLTRAEESATQAGEESACASLAEESATQAGEESACASLAEGRENNAGEGVKDYLTTEEQEAMSRVYVGRIPAAKAEGGEPKPQKKPETLDEYSISTIPEEELPPFSKEYGVNTEGFREFVTKYKLTAPQVAALIKRILK